VLLILPPHLIFAHETQTDEQPVQIDRSTELQNDFVLPKLKKRVEDELPDGARFSRRTMFVILEITVDEFGSISHVRTLAGNLSFGDTGTRAVRQWEFEPARSKGLPVKAFGLITFCFSHSKKMSTSKYTFSFQRCCPESTKMPKPPCSNEVPSKKAS